MTQPNACPGHSYENSKCTICGHTCTNHEFDSTGNCKICDAVCSNHVVVQNTSSDSKHIKKCNACGYSESESHTFNYSDYEGDTHKKQCECGYTKTEEHTYSKITSKCECGKEEDDGGGCVTPDTLITLADGEKKRIDELDGSEELLVWNHEMGEFDSAPVAYIINHDEEVKKREVISLLFDDGSVIDIINEHVFFDVTENKYVALDKNAEKYLNHEFLKVSEEYDGLEKVKLVKIKKQFKNTASYEVVSDEHMTCFTNNLLSACAHYDKMLNIFEIDSLTLTYSDEKIQEDIKQYGLYTYKDFEGLISREAFDAGSTPYLKIAVGKGILTWDEILDWVDLYYENEIELLQIK